MSAAGASADRLYGLLPQVVRLRDAEADLALKELVEILGAQLDVLGADLDQFYADQFIETSAEWVVPYIGDLIGYRAVHGRAPGAPSARAEVANTIAYRRRKGTAAMVEQLARDLTDWPARVVEFFERLVTTQYMNHIRPRAFATADTRRREALSEITRLAGAFDDAAHTIDVRRIDAASPHGRGRYSIPNLGIFLFRTLPMPLVRSELRQHDAADRTRFRFDPLGADTPLFTVHEPEDEITHLALPVNTPMPIPVRRFDDHLDQLYGAQRSLLVEVESVGAVIPVAAADIRASDLRDVAGGWANMPPAGAVAIDTERGRVAFGTPLTAAEKPLGSFHLGMAVPIGARSIGRIRVDDRELGVELPASIADIAGGGDLAPSLATVQSGGGVRIMDSARLSTSAPLTVDAAAPGAPPVVTAVTAANSVRPVVDVGAGGLELLLGEGSTVLLDGLVIEGGPVFLDEVGDGGRRTIVLNDCTLVPGATRTPAGGPGTPDSASLIVLDPFADVVVAGSVTGPIVLVEGATLTIDGCVIDASAATRVAICGREAAGGLRTVSTAADRLVGDGMAESGDVRVTGSTIVGGIHALRLDATDAILLGELAASDPRPAAVWTQRRQVGCLRFSWVPVGSRCGRRFRCQPDRKDPLQTQARMQPAFTSLRFGDPAYGQLSHTTPSAIRRGAEDESEMGATRDLFAPQREDDLAQRLQEYLRFGMSAGVFYAS